LPNSGRKRIYSGAGKRSNLKLSEWPEAAITAASLSAPVRLKERIGSGTIESRIEKATFPDLSAKVIRDA
jgi:hypothetical protein